MKAFALAALIALPMVLGKVISVETTPSKGMSLVGRDLRQMKIYFCNVCTSGCEGEDGCDPECDQTNYATQGGSVDANCNDPSIPMNDDFCSTFGQISTPYGYGDWTSTDKCSSDRSDGAYDGCITASDGSWGCTCFAFGGSFSEFCIQDYECQYIYTCECDACANNNCGTCGG